MPEKPKLKFIDKIPQYPPNIRAPKMQKKLKLIRGEEDVHNFLIHKQYGIKVMFMVFLYYYERRNKYGLCLKSYLNLSFGKIYLM